MSFGYAMNKQRAFQVLDDRAQSLIIATCEALEFRLALSGVCFLERAVGHPQQAAVVEALEDEAVGGEAKAALCRSDTV